MDNNINNSNINIAEINRNQQESYIHYEPNRIDYTISEVELELLEISGISIWKDIFLASLGLGVPSILNGYCGFINLKTPSNFPNDIFLNLLVGCISLILSIICLIVWLRNRTGLRKLIKQIKNKPKYKIPRTDH